MVSEIFMWQIMSPLIPIIMVLRLNRSCITFSLLYHLEITTFNIKLHYSLKGKLFSSHRCHKFHKAMSLVQNLNPKEALWDMADKKDLQHENAADDSEERKWRCQVSIHQKEYLQQLVESLTWWVKAIVRAKMGFTDLKEIYYTDFQNNS